MLRRSGEGDGSTELKVNSTRSDFYSEASSALLLLLFLLLLLLLRCNND